MNKHDRSLALFLEFEHVHDGLDLHNVDDPRGCPSSPCTPKPLSYKQQRLGWAATHSRCSQTTMPSESKNVYVRLYKPEDHDEVIEVSRKAFHTDPLMLYFANTQKVKSCAFIQYSRQ